MLDGKLITTAIRTALRERAHGVSYALTRHLGALFPGFVLETESHEFAIERFANAGHCRLTSVDGMTFQTSHAWHDRSYAHVVVSAWSVDWPGAAGPLHCITVSWSAGDCPKLGRYVAAPRREDAEALFTAVCRWNDDAQPSWSSAGRRSSHVVGPPALRRRALPAHASQPEHSSLGLRS